MIELKGLVYYDRDGNDEQSVECIVRLEVGEVVESGESEMFETFDSSALILVVDTADGNELTCELIHTDYGYILIEPVVLEQLWLDYGNREVEPVFYEIVEQNGERDYHMKFARLKPKLGNIDSYLLNRALTHYGDEVNDTIDGIDGCEVDFGDGTRAYAEGYVISEEEYKVLYKHLHNAGEDS